MQKTMAEGQLVWQLFFCYEVGDGFADVHHDEMVIFCDDLSIQ